jgi:transketolase
MHYRAGEPHWRDRDRFILGKGHAGSALYATLAEVGFFPLEMLGTHCQSGSLLLGHVSHKVPGVEASTGALGHGLPIGCGVAMALRNTESRVLVLLSDGDLNDGSTWEAVMFAGQHKLHNLTVIVDWNRMQAMGESKGIIDMQSVPRKAAEFGWRTRNIDGHNHHVLRSTLMDMPKWDKRPSIVVAHTIKGKGVSWMEGKCEWHYRCLNGQELEKALLELG